MAPGGRPAHADEQPRPRGRRAARRSGRLRRHGARGPELGSLRRHRGVTARARSRRDARRAVGQAGGGLPHASLGAPRRHRQRAARARLGDLGELPRPGAPGSHDVRPDDGRLVDLHRHPGHPAGHLRDVGLARAAPLRQRPADATRGHGWPGWHGRSAAAGRHDERRRGPGRRGRWHAHRQAPCDPIRGRGDRLARRRPGASACVGARRRGPIDRH